MYNTQSRPPAGRGAFTLVELLVALGLLALLAAPSFGLAGAGTGAGGRVFLEPAADRRRVYRLRHRQLGMVPRPCGLTSARSSTGSDPSCVRATAKRRAAVWRVRRAVVADAVACGSQAI
jgi:prepilin-type N-terminal cleavage/methylation domain-containing protein